MLPKPKRPKAITLNYSHVYYGYDFCLIFLVCQTTLSAGVQ